MNGVVDDDLRALIEVFVGSDPERDRTSVKARVDPCCLMGSFARFKGSRCHVPGTY